MHFNMQILRELLIRQLEPLQCTDDTKAYITALFIQYQRATNDLSTQSLTLLFSEAKTNQNFYLFQQIGDWIFFCSTIFPEHLHNASSDYYHSIGRLSYYKCYKLLNNKWPCFENLADEFVPLSLATREIIRHI